MKFKLKHFFALLLIIYIIALFYFATKPHIEKLVPNIGYDKILHFTEFFVFAILLLKTLDLYHVKYASLVFFGICFVIGIISEIVQVLVPSRTFSWLDYTADILGIVSAFIIYHLMKWK
jgi:VanZ family protein